MSKLSAAQQKVISEMNELKKLGRPSIALNDAAKIQDVAPDALRMRYRRGTIDGFRDESGRIFIYRDQLSGGKEAHPPSESRPATDDLLRKIIDRLERMERFQETLLQLLNSTIHELIEHKRDERAWVEELGKQKDSPF